MRLDSLYGSWKNVATAFALLNVLFLTAGHAFGLLGSELNPSEQTLKVPDSKSATGSGITIFSFMASKLCSKITDQCIEISGTGKLNFNDELNARGHFIKYSKEDLEQFATQTASDSSWTSTKLITANAVHLQFKATTISGNIDIAITEGKKPNHGLLCIWSLNGINGPNETLCTNKAFVYIT